MFDTVTATRESAYAGTNVYKKGGKVVSTTKAAIAADGKSMTLTSTGTDAKGQAVNNVSRFTDSKRPFSGSRATVEPSTVARARLRQ